MNSSVVAHRVNCELQTILQNLEWRREISHIDIGRKPLQEIQDSLDFVRNNEKLKNRIMTFEETYILDSLIDFSMVELVEREGEAYINNMINSLRALIHEIIKLNK